MFYICKPEQWQEWPQVLRDFIEQELNAPDGTANLCYDSFKGKRSLLTTLENIQNSICAYTLVSLNNVTGRFQKSAKSHIEHIKSQKNCRIEIEGRGDKFGSCLGDDLDYRNMIAALLLQGSPKAPKAEVFGAALKTGDVELKIHPGVAGCEAYFIYDDEGLIYPVRDCEDAVLCISVLKLNHDKLVELRKETIYGYVKVEVSPECFVDIEPAAASQLLIRLREEWERGCVIEFYFAIKYVLETIVQCRGEFVEG